MTFDPGICLKSLTKSSVSLTFCWLSKSSIRGTCVKGVPTLNADGKIIPPNWDSFMKLYMLVIPGNVELPILPNWGYIGATDILKNPGTCVLEFLSCCKNPKYCSFRGGNVP